MKVCTTAHKCPGFGTIPEGSLWADDSPFVTDENADLFQEVAEAAPVAPKPKPTPRKFGTKEPS